jgi:hypothetical protein
VVKSPAILSYRRHSELTTAQPARRIGGQAKRPDKALACQASRPLQLTCQSSILDWKAIVKRMWQARISLLLIL